MIRKILAYGTLLLAAMTVRAQSVSFLNLPDNAVRMAMGGADAAYSVSKLQERGYYGSVGATFVMWAPELSSFGSRIYMVDGYARLGERLALSAKGKLNRMGPSMAMDADGAASGEFTPSEFMAGLGLHYRIGDNISLLAQADLISSKLAAKFAGQTVAADIGVAYDLNDLSFALTARNLGPSIQYSEGVSSKLPMVVLIGAEKMLGLRGNILEIELDAGYMPYHKCAVIKAGAMFTAFEIVDVMAGYHYASKSVIEPSYATVGLGLNVSVLKLSAAYFFADAGSLLKNTFAVSLGARF